jgi:DNA mismatch endonuclease (patch repair protein)
LPDFLTKKERSARMSRIRGTNTGPEREMFRMLRREGVYFARHARGLPGSPDIVFRRCRLAVFIDGDFWHGRRFRSWSTDLNDFWREKITRNISRDRRTARQLRIAGWQVLRFWAKDLERDPEATLRLVLRAREKLQRRGLHSLTKKLK